jgi:hypothetical protein
MARLKTGLSRYTDGALVAKADHVIDQLTANVALFPAPNPDLAVLTTGKQAFADSMAQALLGLKSAFSEKRTRRAALEALLNQASMYVANVANGDESKIILGGFAVRKTAVPAPLPSVPDLAPTRVSEYTGQVDLAWKASGARSYTVQMTDKDPSVNGAIWITIGNTTKRAFSMAGLESGRIYWFKVFGINATGVGPASDVRFCRAA